MAAAADVVAAAAVAAEATAMVSNGVNLSLTVKTSGVEVIKPNASAPAVAIVVASGSVACLGLGGFGGWGGEF